MSKVPRKVTAKIVKAKVSKPKIKKKKTKRLQSWEIWAVDLLGSDGSAYVHQESCLTKKDAEEVVAHSDYIAPVIVHVDILPVEYEYKESYWR